MIEPAGRQKVLYYALGLAPPVVFREWVERDVASTGFILRQALTFLIALVLGFAISAILLGGSWWNVFGGFIGGLIGALLQATLLAGYVRRRTLSYYRKKWERQLTT